MLGPKELIVKSVRGSLQIAVEDDVREIPEGAAYRVVLDQNAPPPQEPQSTEKKRRGGGAPIKGARSNFIWYAIAITAAVTAYVASEVLESPDKP